MKELYKKEICINCANKNCTDRIEEIQKTELEDTQIKTMKITKCVDFIPKVKREQVPIKWQSWGKGKKW